MMLNDFEIKRIEYIISQLDKKVTYTALGPGDADILKKLLETSKQNGTKT